MKKPMKQQDGMYHIKGKQFPVLMGTRAQVHHGTAYKTPGGLTKDKLVMNKHGRIVSKVKHITAKKEKRLQKYGYFTKKGKFGSVKQGTSMKKSRKAKKIQKRQKI